MVKYLYDDDEEELYDFYDEDPDDPYPEVIIEINEEQMLKLYEKSKGVDQWLKPIARAHKGWARKEELK